MTASAYEKLKTIRPGDRITVRHEVKVGFRRWWTEVAGKVVDVRRERHGMHYARATDDGVYHDAIVIEKDDGERTTVTVDDFTEIESDPGEQ